MERIARSIVNKRSSAIASLELDPASKRYRVRFRYGGHEFKRSLRTKHRLVLELEDDILEFRTEANGLILLDSLTRINQNSPTLYDANQMDSAGCRVTE